MQFPIASSDPQLLEKAKRIAREFVEPHLGEDVVGICFLGAIVRGYFDCLADVDIAIFKKQGARLPIERKFYNIEGIEVQVWLSDYEDELTLPWDMARRWTYSQALIHFDPQGKIGQLLKDKVPLKPDERKWLMMSGLTLSEWYVNRLTDLWVERGNPVSAQHMFDQGLVYFFDMLFGLNDTLVADMKWRYYCVEQLERLPRRFKERIQEVMTLRSFTAKELARRKAAFMEMWREMQPVVEADVGVSFEEMVEVV